tara:strand:+ start:300 stop:686 length:387 start_codon:yes stop_codon:yes gene_type:complete
MNPKKQINNISKKNYETPRPWQKLRVLPRLPENDGYDYMWKRKDRHPYSYSPSLSFKFGWKPVNGYKYPKDIKNLVLVRRKEDPTKILNLAIAKEKTKIENSKVTINVLLDDIEKIKEKNERTKKTNQ